MAVTQAGWKPALPVRLAIYVIVIGVVVFGFGGSMHQRMMKNKFDTYLRNVAYRRATTAVGLGAGPQGSVPALCEVLDPQMSLVRERFPLED